MHILLVEPDRSLAHIYTEALTHRKHTVSHSANAQDAVSLADEHHPDLVILELELAVHNGIEFLYEFRSYPGWQSVPVIILSHVPPDIDTMDPHTLRRLGVVQYHYKPTTKLTDLVRVVESMSPAAKTS